MQYTSIFQFLFIALGLLFFLVAIQSHEASDQSFWSAVSIIFGTLAYRQQVLDTEEEIEP